MPEIDPRDRAVNRDVANAALVMVGAFLPIAVFSLWGAHVIPEPAVIAAGLTAAAGGTIGVVVFIFRSMKKSMKRFNKPVPLVIAFAGVVLPVGFVFFHIGSQAFMFGLPDIYTRQFGQSAIRPVTAIRWYPEFRTRYTTNCAGVTIAEIPEMIGRLCTPRPVDPGTKLILHGRESLLGFDVDNID